MKLQPEGGEQKPLAATSVQTDVFEAVMPKREILEFTQTGERLNVQLQIFL